MKISVIIPTYKPGRYIAECLESLGCQTLAADDYEIIIVLNGCNEPWHSELDSLIKRYLRDKNVRFIQTDKSGVSNARNIAIDFAKGEYITFIDDDDYVSPAYLEELLKHSSRDRVALTDCIYFDDESRKEMIDNAHHRNFVKNHQLTSPTLFQTRVFFNGPVMKLLHRDIIGERRFNPRFINGEDNLMMFGISDRIKKVTYTSTSAIYYRRIRENSATTKRRTRSQRIGNSMRIMVEYCKYLSKHPFGYNLSFILSRFAAELKSMITD
jgi:glycosyltransferase, group 2 family protein